MSNMFVRRTHAFCYAALLGPLVIGCGDDDNGTTPPVDEPDGAVEAGVTDTEGAPSETSTAPTSNDTTNDTQGPTHDGETSSVVDDGGLPDGSLGDADAPDAEALDADLPDASPLDADLTATEAGDSDAGDGSTASWWPDASGWQLTSPSFDDGEPFEDAFTCNDKPFGEGAFPGLDWTQGPPRTKSYAVVFKDTSILEQNDPATINRAFHWAIWDIPADVHSLPTALGENDDEFPNEVSGARQWAIRYQFGYFPPCPNTDNSIDAAAFVTDHYEFTLYALDTEIFDYPAPDEAVNNYTRTLDAALEAAAIAKISLHATSDAAASEPPGPPPAREDIDFPSERP